MFLRHMRFDEISLSLLNYYKTNDIIPCMKCLQAIKADLKAFEYMKKQGFFPTFPFSKPKVKDSGEKSCIIKQKIKAFIKKKEQKELADATNK